MPNETLNTGKFVPCICCHSVKKTAYMQYARDSVCIEMK